MSGLRLASQYGSLVDMSATVSVLMSAPDYFEVCYQINPWMDTANQVDRQLAKKQWQDLYQIYQEQLGWQVSLIEPVEGLPDMVFTANGGLVVDGRVALPNFRHYDRQAETEHFAKWFRDHDYQEVLLPRYNFEGEGDALIWQEYILAGYPWRSTQLAHQELANHFQREVISLQLIDARFYHLDTCLTPIDQDTIAIYPAAFSSESIAKLKKLVKRLIMVEPDDALAYGLNAICQGKEIVIPDQAKGLIAEYTKLGFNCWPTAISEFQKSGGGIKCLTLQLR